METYFATFRIHSRSKLGIHVLRLCLPLLNYVQRLCDKACRPQNLKTAPDTAAPLVADGLKN